MKTVLIADDHPIMLSGIESLIAGAGYEVVSRVSDGAQVLSAVVATAPDILLLDVSMPGMTGIEVLRQLRAQGREAKVVLLTAQLDDEALLEALQLGADGIVLKNGGERSLLDCLEKVAAGGRWIPQDLLVRSSHLREEQKSDPLNSLSDRERDVSRLVAQGLRNRAIADELGLSEGTIKVYLNRIYEKLGISSRTELLLAMSRDRNAGR
jgi:two-component system, NarL family, nitrate/nitrite response regulator NarL